MGHFITGLVTELLTAFHEDGSVDYKMTGDLVDFQLSKGVNNFFVNGLGGECHELTVDEQVNCLKEVYSRTKGNAKIMACAFLHTVADNKRLIDLYEETGAADCYCITAPPFFHHNQDALYDYAAELIDHAKQPVYIYNSVQMGTLFAPETLAKLWKNHKNFRGYKDATVDPIHFMKTVLLIDKDNFDFLGGCDGLDGVMMTLGAVGCVSFLAVTCPVEMKEMIDYGLAGDYHKCIEAQYKVMRIRNVLKLAPFNAAYMYALKYTGGPVAISTRMVKAQLAVSDEAKAKIDATFKELGY